MPPPQHIAWLIDTQQRIQTADGRTVEVWELQHNNDPAVLSEWAKHLRQHYCDDALFDQLIEGTGQTRAQYLVNIKFPDAANAPGPSIRAGDFAEILLADYVEYKLGYWCPRQYRYENKINRNESSKGCDIVGFRFVDGNNPNPNDELLIVEAKARLSGNQAVNRLQDAVNDSEKDFLREPMTLNAIKQRYLERDDNESATKVQRFQNPADRPFRRVNGAAAVYTENIFAPNLVQQTITGTHPNANNLKLIVVKGPTLMALVHALYQRAADEA